MSKKKFLKNLDSIEKNIPLLQSQVKLLRKNPNLHKNEAIDSVVYNCEFIPKLLGSLLDAVDIS